MTNRIGRYEIQAELGRGGFGRVFRAFDPTVGRMVAIKTLNTSGEQDMLTRFRNEAAAAGRLHHQNIVIVYDFGEHDGSPFLVMELLDGEDVERIITNNRPLTLLKKLDVMMQAAAGLHHAHSKGIVHRDVKPANIMLLSDGSVKIMDFGIALLTQATAERITPQGSMIGTLPYMAPEQFFGQPSSVMTDIFAFGVSFYKLLTGKHPFYAAELGSMMNNIANQQQAPLRSLSPECPEALEQVINKLLAKNPDLRYLSLEDTQFDLDPIILDLRKENVGELISETRNLIASDQLETAQSMVRQVFEIDPGNRTARELRETIQRQIRDRAVRPKITALVTAGREQLIVRQFEEAIQKFESALVLDKSNLELQRMLEQARAAAERARRADQLLNDAQQALHRDDLTAAHKNVADALATDPEHARAESLLGDVRQRMEVRQREQRMLDGLNHIKGLMLLQSFAEAIDAAARFQAEYPESSEAKKILERARQELEAQNRRARLQAAVEEAKELLKNRRFAEAVQRLAQLQQEFPDATELRDLASYAAREWQSEKQAEVVARTTSETRSLVEAGDFDGALERLESALREFPSLTALRDLVQHVGAKKAEHQRTVALKEAIRASTALVAANRFSEAMERIDVFVRAYGDRSDLNPVRRQAEEGLERQRRAAAMRKLVADAQALLDDGKPGPAAQVLEQATVQFPENAEVAELLGVARNSLREQQQVEAISKVIAEAESVARSKRFDQALEIISEGQGKYPAAERLLRCREAIVASQAAYQKEQARKQMVERARHLHAQGKEAEALQAIETTLSSGIEDDGLLTLRRQIETDLAERRRLEEIRHTLAEAQSLVEGGRLDSAVQLLQQGVRLHPAETQIKKLLDQLEARLQQQQREEAIAGTIKSVEPLLKGKEFDKAIKLLDDAIRRLGPEKALAQARESAVADKAAHEAQVRQQQRADAIAKALRDGENFIKSDDFDRAVKLIDETVKRHGADDALKRLRETALTGKAAHERVLALVQERARATELKNAGKLGEAVQSIDAAIKRLGDDPGLVALKRDLEAERESRKRDEEANNALRKAADFLSRNDPAAAVKALKAAPAHSALQEQLAKLLTTAEAKLKEQQREQAIAAIVEEVGRARANGQFDQALKALEPALRQFPGVDQLDRLRTAVFADKARGESLAEANQLLRDGHFEAALQEVQKVLRTSPADNDFLQLKTRIEADQAKHKQAVEIRKIVEQAKALIAKDRLDDAMALLQRAATQYPGEQAVDGLLKTTDDELQKRRRAKELEQVRVQAETMVSQHKCEEAVALIDSRFPKEPALQEVRSRAQKEVDEKRREALIQKAIAIGREKRYEDAIKVVEEAVSLYGPNETTAKLHKSLQSSLDLKLRREARERDQAQLLAIEQQLGTGPRKGKLKKLASETQSIVARYEADPEIANLGTRILKATATVAAEKKPAVSPPVMIGGGVGVAAILGAAYFFLHTPAPPPVTVFPVEIRSQPPGATVHIQDKSCVTPDCRFDLKPGQYQLDAQLEGYKPVHQPVDVTPSKVSLVVNLILEPVPTPPPLGDNTTPTGALVVRAGVPDAVVHVDGTVRGRTGPSGALSLTLEAKAHEVSVERSGYDNAPPQKVSIAKGVPQVVTFTLVPQAASLELLGAPRGVEVRIGNTLLGSTNGSASYRFPGAINPGNQTLQLALGGANRSLQQRFESGQMVRLEWKDVAPGAPPPTPEAIERQDWERVRTSSDVAQLRGYLSSHPNGPHAPEATARIADLAWTAVDQANITAVRNFARDNPNNIHKADAQKIIDQYDAAQQRLAQDRDKQEKAKLEQARVEQGKLEQQKLDQAKQEQLKLDQAKQERAKLDQARKQLVLDTLKELDSALQRKRPADIRAVWPTTSSTFLDSVRSPQVDMSLITSDDVQFPQADRAVVHSDLVVRVKSSNAAPKHQRATVTLHSSGAIWTVDSLKVE